MSAHQAARNIVSLSQDGSQRWVLLENIARFEKRLASERCHDQRHILEHLIGWERKRLATST